MSKSYIHKFLIGSLIACTLSFGAASAQSYGSMSWAGADMRLSESMDSLEAEVLECGSLIKDFSQGRISHKEAKNKSERLLGKAKTNFAKISNLDKSADMNLYCCGIDAAKRQLQQIKAANDLLDKEEIFNKDILALQADSKVYKSQLRYLNARLKSVSMFIREAERNKRRSDSSRVKTAQVSDEVIKFYKFEKELLPLQIKELEYSERLMPVLEAAASGKSIPKPDILNSCRALEKQCRNLSAEGDMSSIRDKYCQEFSDFARFAESVLLLKDDVSADSLSRLNRWNDKLKKSSRAAKASSSSAVKKYLGRQL